MNCVEAVADTFGRDYITPEDINDAFKTNPASEVQMAVLDCISRGNVEDSSCCAFVAKRGTYEPDMPPDEPDPRDPEDDDPL